MTTVLGQLWLRGGASVLLLEGCLFDSPGLRAEVLLGRCAGRQLVRQPPPSVYELL